jgi:hypothetical protein
MVPLQEIQHRNFACVCVLPRFPQCTNRTTQISILRTFFLFPIKYTEEFHLSLYRWGQQGFLLADGSVGNYPAIHPIRISPHPPVPKQCYIYSATGHDKTQVCDGKINNNIKKKRFTLPTSVLLL